MEDKNANLFKFDVEKINPEQKLFYNSYWTEKENISIWNWVIGELFFPLQKGYSIFIIFCAIFLNCVFVSILFSISWSFLCSFPLWNYIFIQWKWSYLKMAYFALIVQLWFQTFSDFLTIFFILTCFISLIDCNRLLWNMNFWCSFLNLNKLYFVILLNFCTSCEFFTVTDIGNKKKMMFRIVYTVLWIWISHINKYWICI